MENFETKESNSFDIWNKCFAEAENGEYSPPIQKNESGEILAPNGLVSQLPSELFAIITRTPSFKEWFGDWVETEDQEVSKVSHPETGEPLLLGHRTNVDIPIEEGLSVEKADIGEHMPKPALYFTTCDFIDYGKFKFFVFLHIVNPSSEWNEEDGSDGTFLESHRPDESYFAHACVYANDQIMHVASPIEDKAIQ